MLPIVVTVEESHAEMGCGAPAYRLTQGSSRHWVKKLGITNKVGTRRWVCGHMGKLIS